MTPPPPPPPGYEPPSAEPPSHRPSSYGPTRSASPPGPAGAPNRPPRRDPATEILAWLRGAFDGVNSNLRALSDRVAAQEAAISAASGSQAAELNVTLAELEGCAAQLRNEAAAFAETKAALVEALPGLVGEAVGPALTRTVEQVMGEAVRPAVGDTVDRAVAELRLAVAELAAALTEAVPAAVVDAVAAALDTRLPAPGTLAAEPAAGGAAPVAPTAVDAADEASGDPVSQLHQAQDEAAEWFSIVVEEAVRQAVERYLGPVVTAAGAAAATGAPAPAPAPAAEPAPAADPPAPPAATTPPAPDPAPDPEAALRGGPESASPAGPTAPAVPDTPLPEAAADPVTAPGGEAARRPEPAAAGDPPPAPGVASAPDGAPRPEGEADNGFGAGDDPRPPSDVACALPGAFVGPTLALGTREALRRARLRRRRRRRAGAPAAGLFLNDPFAGEISQALERFALSRRGLAFGAGGAEGGEPPANGVVVVGERDGQEVVVDLASAPLALVGPGAASAARALVATFLACTEPAAGEALVVGDLFPPGRGFPGLRRPGDRGRAVDELEAELTRREAYRTEEGAPPLPALLVVTVATAPPDDRLAGLLARGRALGVGAVVVGSEAEGATAVTVLSRGSVRSVAPADGAPLAGSQLFVLDEAAAAELLGVLAAARTDDERVPTLPVEDEPFVVLAPSEPTPISVRVLGDYRIEAGGREIRSGLRAKAKELLAFYLLHPQGTTLDVATEALWPEAAPTRGSEWFWTALGNLRSLLRSTTDTKSLKVIERDGDRYKIEPIFEVDLWRFQEALPPAGAGTGDPEWAAGLETAADLYGGDLLAGVDWAWAEIPREDLRRRAVDVLVSLAATRLVAGDARAALDALSRAVEVDPVAEQLYRRIMRLHARQARVDEVEATYLRLKARLAELDLEPTPESQQLLAELSRTGHPPPTT